MSHRGRLFLSIALAVAAVVTSLLLTRCASSRTMTRDAGFIELVGTDVRFGAGLELDMLDSPLYSSHGMVGFRALNHTGHDLFFPNEEFGAKAYVYDVEDETWRELESLPLVNTTIRCLSSGANDLEETLAYVLFDPAELQGVRELRMYVEGVGIKLQQGTQVEVKYGAYADVRVVQGGPTPIVETVDLRNVTLVPQQ